MAVPHSGVPAPSATPADATVDELTANTATIGTLITTLGGELGGTPAAATVAALHGGSTHAAVQAAAEATASSALGDHVAASDPHAGYPLTTEVLHPVGGGKETVKTVAASGSALTVNLADGNLHDITLTASCTLTLTGATAGVGCWLTLILRQDGTGGRTVSWPVSVAWPEGTPPTLQPGAGDLDIITLFTVDGGTVWNAAPPPLTEAAHAALAHAFVGCVAQRTTNQTAVPTTTPTALQLTGTDAIDTHGYHDPATNPSRITIPAGKGGKYRLSAFVPWDTDNTGYRQVFFRKNGAGYLAIQQYMAVTSAGVNTYQTFTAPPILLSVGDYVEAYVEHNSGTDRTLIGATFPMLFSVEFLGA